MRNAEICLLGAIGQNHFWLNNPWQYPGFTELAKAFLKNHTVIMGREAWFDFPLKHDTSITPWILSHNQYFHIYTRERYPHARFVDTLEVIHRVIPTKGIWWVLGGHSVYRDVLPFADCIEATLVTGMFGQVNLGHALQFAAVHRCPHPYRSTMECIRYERQHAGVDSPAVQVHEMQAN